MRTPAGYMSVEHADGAIHAISLDRLHDDRPLWREPVICGSASGVSSDEGGPAAVRVQEINCWECISILS